MSFYNLVQDNSFNVTREDIRKAYVENLELVLNDVETLVDKLDGKTVISVDHGEHLGEQVIPFGKQMYAHPTTVRSQELCCVPWLEIEGKTRRSITAEPPVEADEPVDEDVVDKRLAALGYKN